MKRTFFYVMTSFLCLNKIVSAQEYLSPEEEPAAFTLS